MAGVPVAVSLTPAPSATPDSLDASFVARGAEDLSKAELVAEIRATFRNATPLDVSLIYITCHGSYEGGMSFLELSDGSSISARDLERELRATAQRVNLFEKVKIPEAKENIRVIGIYLGDQQTSAVVRGKIAKKKLQEVSG